MATAIDETTNAMAAHRANGKHPGVKEKARKARTPRATRKLKYAADSAIPDEAYSEQKLLAALLELKRGDFSARLPVGEVRSLERLVSETALFLHREIEQLPPERREMFKRIHKSEAILAAKMVLVVDDDIRNIFTMTSLLERHGMQIVVADSGLEALERLYETPNIDIVLMDIMMPTMDGYATIRAIRESEQFTDLPVIAVTAKAMKGDREKCLDAGASDYIAKPVDTDYLLAMLQTWLRR